MKRASLVTAVLVAAAGSVLGTLGACGSSSSTNPGGRGGSGDGGLTSGDSGFTNLEGDGSCLGCTTGDAPTSTCTGLQCQIHSCTGTTTGTTITGHVYDPAGNNPLYSVVVYVPNTAVEPLPVAPANECGSCNSLYTGTPIAAAITDATGKFVIQNAPDGANIPLVVQIGKWRAQLVIPTVAACPTGDGNDLDKSLGVKITLPSAAGIPTGGPGKGLQQDIPNIAISTGGADTLECLLRRIGVDASEYTPGPGGTGHIHIFQGSSIAGQLPNAARMAAAAGTTPTSKTSLWDQATDLSPYDILILSCEGQETRGDADGGGVSVAEQTALRDFTNAGGRAFLSHFHYSFLDTGPFANPPLAAWTAGANPIEDQGGIPDVTLGDIVTVLPDGGKFPKGEAFYQWLGETDSLTGTQLQIVSAKNNALVTAADTPSQTWISADQNAVSEGTAKTTSAAGATEYFTFDTPIGGMGTDEAGAPIYCGRVVFSDLHVGGASGDYPGQQGVNANPTVPTGCANNPLSAQEKALEFMLFDLSSCVTPDTSTGQQPPPIVLPK